MASSLEELQSTVSQSHHMPCWERTHSCRASVRPLKWGPLFAKTVQKPVHVAKGGLQRSDMLDMVINLASQLVDNFLELKIPERKLFILSFKLILFLTPGLQVFSPLSLC